MPPLLAQRLLAVYSHPGSSVLAAGASARLIARTASRLDRQPPARTPRRRVAAGSVDLLIATPAGPDTTGAPASTAPSADHVAGWARQLRPAGILAVVLHPSRTPAEPAALVAEATGAGLTYLQHVVALTWPLHEAHLDPPTTRSSEPAQPAGGLGHVDVLVFTGPGPHSPSSPGQPDRAEPLGASHPAGVQDMPATGGRDEPPVDCPSSPDVSGAVVAGSVWPVAQTSARTQRRGRYGAESVAHPAKMLPALARTAIATFTKPGDLVLDPMCGIGTTLVEAVHAGRDAVGVEYEARWAQLARDNIELAVDSGAPGHAAVRTGDARHAAALLGPDLTGRVRLLLTSPPYGSATHGQVHAGGAERGKVRKWNTGYGHDRANLAHRPLPELLDGFADILRACLPLLAPGGVVVLTTRPYRHHGALVDLPGAGHAHRDVTRAGAGRPLRGSAGRHPRRTTRPPGLVLPTREHPGRRGGRRAAADPSARGRLDPAPARTGGTAVDGGRAMSGGARLDDSRVWSAADVRALGVSTDLVTAASILGVGRTVAYAMARAGTFPVPVHRVGRLYRVPTAPILRLLAIDPAPASAGPAAGWRAGGRDG
jgi:SAM-dependent methyltransferase